MITSVRFPTPVAVIKGDMRVEWKPGDRGVRSIASYPHGMVAFVFADGIREVVCPPGTVIDTTDTQAPDVMPWQCQQCGTTGGAHSADCPTVSGPLRVEQHEPAASEASDSPPPARPIPKSGRVRR